MTAAFDAFLSRFSPSSQSLPENVDLDVVDDLPGTPLKEIPPVNLTRHREIETSTTRNSTPFPTSRVSFSSRSRQSSFRGLPTIPDSPTHGTAGRIGVSMTSLPHNSPEALRSPSRTSRMIDPNETPASITMSSTHSTPAELSFGPQPLSFVLRRRAVTSPSDNSPTEMILSSFDFRPNSNISTAAVITRPDGEYNRDAPFPTEKQRDSKVTFADNENHDENADPADIPMSTWRADQIKYTKRARRGQDLKPKPIPALHGPLSLPYARNPSGVDATIADHDAYLSNVFGLRAAPPLPTPLASRSTSRGSGTDTTRSTSGNSVVYMRTRAKVSVGETRPTVQSTILGGRPLMQRDPYQNIGIRKGAESRGNVEEPGGQPQIPIELDATPVITEAPRKPYGGTIAGDSEKPAHLPSPAALAIPTTASSMLRAQLSLNGQSLSPIPGSPSVEPVSDPFRLLFDEAIGIERTEQHSTDADDLPEARNHQRGTSLPNPPRGSRTGAASFYRYPEAYSYPSFDSAFTGAEAADLRASTPARIRAASHEYTVPLPQIQGMLPSPQVLRTVPPPATLPPVTASVPLQPSKADISDNWRLKSQRDQTAVVSQKENIPETPKGQDDSVATDIMTIDSLFAKFEKQLSPKITFSPPTPIDTPMKATSPLRVTARTTSNHFVPLKASLSPPLGESSGKAINVVSSQTKPTKSAAGSSNKASLAKGTPNAGKLLKKATALATKEKIPPVPKFAGDSAPIKSIVEGKGKGKARK